jgi:hypothetical protein
MKTLGCQHGASIRSPHLRHRRVSRERNSLRPLRPRPLLRLAVHFQIHLLIEVAQMVFYAGGCGYGGRIVPEDRFPGLTTRLHRVVRRNPLVGKLRSLVAREQYVLRDFLRGN